MTSKFVMANIKMPIEIKPDNTIVPMQHLSNVYIVSVIDSIDEIAVDMNLPDIISQAHKLVQPRLPVCTTQPPLPEIIVPDAETTTEINEDDNISKTGLPPQPQLWIHPEELHKKPPLFKKNASFKNHGKYNHRVTAKTREYNNILSR